MKFLKSYWWAFALIIAAILIYWFVFREDSSVVKPKTQLPPKLNPNCPLTVQAWMDMYNAKIAEVRPKAYLQAKVDAGEYTNLDAAAKGEAYYILTAMDGICDPTKAPTA